METLSFLNEGDIRNLAKKYGTPLYVYDEKGMEESAKYMLGIPNAYGVTVRYSVKANPNRNIIKIFDRLGCHFDVSSVYEAQRVIRAGVSEILKQNINESPMIK